MKEDERKGNKGKEGRKEGRKEEERKDERTEGSKE